MSVGVIHIFDNDKVGPVRFHQTSRDKMGKKRDKGKNGE